jgi:hypothetical protein
MAASKRSLALALALSLLGCGARSTLDAPLESDAPPDEGDPCSAEGATMQVPSTAAWFDTGIDVIAGERLRVTATGMVRYGNKDVQVIDADGGNYTGQRFFSAAVLPNTIICSLIGKVGGTTDLGTGALLTEGAPGEGTGFVGTAYDEIVQESGRLFLGFNDQTRAFGDNSGAFTVVIRLTC